MALQLRVFAGLAEDPSSAPRTHLGLPIIFNSSSRESNPLILHLSTH